MRSEWRQQDFFYVPDKEIHLLLESLFLKKHLAEVKRSPSENNVFFFFLMPAVREGQKLRLKANQQSDSFFFLPWRKCAGNPLKSIL